MNQELAPEKMHNLKNVALIVYILQACFFITGITMIIGVIINYVKHEDVEHTWLDSHFRWQIRTFWYGLLWFAVAILTWPLFFVGFIVFIAAGIWLIYRIVKGLLALNDGKEMYLELNANS